MKTRILAHTLAGLPIFTWGMSVLYAVYALSVVGHWPSYNNPDPSNLPSSFLNVTVGVVFLAAVLSFAAYPLLLVTLVTWDRFKKTCLMHGYRRHVGLYALSWTLWLADFKFLGIFNWLLD